MPDDKTPMDPVDGSTAEFTASERLRLRSVLKFVEDERSGLHFWAGLWRVARGIISNWKAWGIGLTIVAFMRRPEFLALLDMLTGVSR
jgi:hypothetical protein